MSDPLADAERALSVLAHSADPKLSYAGTHALSTLRGCVGVAPSAGRDSGEVYRSADPDSSDMTGATFRGELFTAPPKPAPDAVREALKPFAQLFERFEEGRKTRGDNWPDDHVEFNARPRTDKESTGYTFGDLRRAHEAFSSAPVPSPDGVGEHPNAEAGRAGLRAATEFARHPIPPSGTGAAEPVAHYHRPSTMHMGDCAICGNISDHPLHIGSPSFVTPPVRGDRETIARAICEADGRDYDRERELATKFESASAREIINRAHRYADALSLPVQPGAKRDA